MKKGPTYITVQVVRTDMTNYVEDYLAYGLLPGLGYLALLAGRILCRPVLGGLHHMSDLISDSHKVGADCELRHS